MSQINLLKHFFFSSFINQTAAVVRKAKPDNDYGKVVSLSFIMTKEKTVMRLKFERFEGDSILSEDEKKKLLKIVGVDADKEMDNCTSIFAVLLAEKKTINITYNKNDGTSNLVTI